MSEEYTDVQKGADQLAGLLERGEMVPPLTILIVGKDGDVNVGSIDKNSWRARTESTRPAIEFLPGAAEALVIVCVDSRGAVYSFIPRETPTNIPGLRLVKPTERNH